MLDYMKDLARLLRRVAIMVVGTVILVVGVVLLVAPGPGLLVILLALTVFAAEFEWARRRLKVFGIGTVGIGGVLIFTDLLPLSGAGTGAGVVLGGLTVLVTTAYSVRELRRAQKAESVATDRGGAPARR
jgi:putative transmembrane protein PGPGW